VDYKIVTRLHSLIKKVSAGGQTRSYKCILISYWCVTTTVAKNRYITAAVYNLFPYLGITTVSIAWITPFEAYVSKNYCCSSAISVCYITLPSFLSLILLLTLYGSNSIFSVVFWWRQLLSQHQIFLLLHGKLKLLNFSKLSVSIVSTVPARLLHCLGQNGKRTFAA
jgi:hypothetical protein